MSGGPERTIVRRGLWRRLGPEAGLERFELLRGPGTWALQGTILASGEHGPTEARYEVICDAGWRTRQAEVAIRDALGDRGLRLNVQDGRWFADGRELEAVRGCVDVDLGWSPSTNTLPIRRLGLALGQKSGPIVAAWVRFPQLAVEPLPQQYERIGETRYRYTSRDGAFTADLAIDDEGLVIDYSGVWERADLD